MPGKNEMNKTVDNRWLIGIDAGTTGLKSLAFDLAGKTLAHSYREYPLCHPDPVRAEQDPEEWWKALAETVRDVAEQSGRPKAELAGLSISSQGSTFVLLGADHQLLCPAISWLDRRSSGLTNFGDISDETLFSTTGLRAYPGWTGSVLRWMGMNDSALMNRVRHYLLVGDYLIYRLTGAIATDFSSASRTRMLDLGSRRWSPEILDALGVREEQLPSLGASGDIAGRISAEGAAATGLLEGTPVMLGGFDQSCMALGAGTITPDALMVSLGTGTMAQLCSPLPVSDAHRRVSTSCHALAGMWMLQAPINTTGATLRWWRDNFFPHQEKAGVYKEMDRLAAAVPLGADGVMMFPHLSGGAAPHWDTTMDGAILGLTLQHTQGHLIRAILEGVAMEIALSTTVMESLGFNIGTVRIVGGGASSSLWRSIIADVLGKPQVCVKENEVGALGAAMLAAAGAGLFEDVREAVRAMAPMGDHHSYDAANHAAYKEVRKRHAEYTERLYSKVKVVPADARWNRSSAS